MTAWGSRACQLRPPCVVRVRASGRLGVGTRGKGMPGALRVGQHSRRRARGGVLVSVWCGSSRRDAVVAPQDVHALRRAVKRLKQAAGSTRAALGGALGGVLMAATITAGPSVPTALAAEVVPPQAMEEEEEETREHTPDDWAAMLLSAAPMFSAPEPLGVGALATPEGVSDPWFSAPVPSLSMPEQQAMLEYLQGEGWKVVNTAQKSLRVEALEALFEHTIWSVAGPALGLFLGVAVAGKVAEDRRDDAARYALRSAAAAMDTKSLQEVLQTMGLPPWAALRDIERPGWANQVVETIWPYLDKATADAIVVNVDPILEEYRPPVFSSIKFDKFTFGNIPATVEGVKVYDTGNEGSVEADIFVVWAGNPNVVLGVRAAGDAVNVPVNVTDVQLSGCVRLIFKPLLTYFPLFGAIEISLASKPQVNFDLRVVGSDITLLPGVAAVLKSFLKNLLASFMVWPRRIVVPIAGESLKLPIRIEEGFPNAVPGKLLIRVIGWRALPPTAVSALLALAPSAAATTPAETVEGEEASRSRGGAQSELPADAFGPNSVTVPLTGDGDDDDDDDVREFSIDVEDWRSKTLWAAVYNRETPDGETVESGLEGVEGASIALGTAVNWAAGPALLTQVDLIDILPELTGEGEDTGWVSVPLDLQAPWRAEEAAEESASGFTVGLWRGVVGASAGVVGVGKSGWRVVKEVPGYVGRVPGLIGGLRSRWMGGGAGNGNRGDKNDEAAAKKALTDGSGSSSLSALTALSEAETELDQVKLKRLRSEEATLAAVQAAEAAMAAAQKVRRSTMQPQLRIDVRFQPQAVAFDPTLFKTKYYSAREHYVEPQEFNRTGATTASRLTSPDVATTPAQPVAAGAAMPVTPATSTGRVPAMRPLSMSSANGMPGRVEVNQPPHRKPAAAASVYAASSTTAAAPSAVAPSSSPATGTAAPATPPTSTQREAAAATSPTAAVTSKQMSKSKRTAAEKKGEKTAEEQIALLREVIRDATEQLPLADAEQLTQLESVLRRATGLLNSLRDSHH